MADMNLSRDVQPVSDARANLTELIGSVRHRRRAVLLSSRGKEVAGLVPAELASLALELGPDEAVDILRAYRDSAGKR